MHTSPLMLLRLLLLAAFAACVLVCVRVLLARVSEGWLASCFAAAASLGRSSISTSLLLMVVVVVVVPLLLLLGQLLLLLLLLLLLRWRWWLLLLLCSPPFPALLAVWLFLALYGSQHPVHH